MACMNATPPYFRTTFSEPDVIAYPSVPYSAPLSQLSDGFMITITGKVFPEADRFFVNFSIGDERDGPHGTALHLNPRFNEGLIIRNSFLDNIWGAEETDGPGMPLKLDKEFELIILVTDTCYKVAINGEHFCVYNHRVAKEEVNFLVIEGDVLLHQVQLNNPRKPVGLPYKHSLPNGAVAGTVVRIHGKSKTDANVFVIDFRIDENEDRVFHFVPRFDPQVVVRNTQKDGVWGVEEKTQPKFPFKRGEEFKIIIFSDPEKFQVIINNENFVTYSHRFQNLDKISFIRVDGDLDLYNVQL